MELSWKTFEEELAQAAFAGSIKFWQIFLTTPHLPLEKFNFVEMSPGNPRVHLP
jgi:hypothetical protein